MTETFFEIGDDDFVPTELTRGPWNRDHQHAGPPAALLGRALERHEPRGDTHIGRVTFELLRGVPIAPLRITVRTLRGGRRVELIEATLSDGEGEVMRATAWRLRTTDVAYPDPPPPPGAEPPPGPDTGHPGTFFPTGETVGYHSAMEYRFVNGDFIDMGPATVWMRMRHPLVTGEDPSPLQRVLIAADSGNGVSAMLDYERYLFVNVDLTVQLHRPPAGEWVALDAITIPEHTGVGVSDTLLHDERGRIGRALQTLLVAARDD